MMERVFNADDLGVINGPPPCVAKIDDRIIDATWAGFREKIPDLTREEVVEVFVPILDRVNRAVQRNADTFPPFKFVSASPGPWQEGEGNRLERTVVQVVEKIERIS